MVNLVSIFYHFLRLGLTSFGGPAMVAYIRELVVDKKRWLDNETFKEGVALAQAVPGATAMQVAAFVGFKTRGILGGILSYSGFALPAFILMLILSVLYEKTHSTQIAMSIFKGLQVVVIAIVANVTLSFAKPIIKSVGEIFIALLAFAFFVLKFNPFFIIIICFFISQLIFRQRTFPKQNSSKQFNLKGFFIVFMIFIIFNFSFLFFDKILFDLALTMIKIDLFAFGGGYVSLPLMLHEFVYRLNWIDQKTFMDGVALGQITPGPIVITATFIGYLLKGFVGAVVATLAIFTPSFLIMMFASEMSEKIRNSKFFARAQRGLIASFTGLLLFVTIKFAEDIDWSIIKIAMAITCFVSLYMKINIFYVVIGGVLVSLIIF